MTYATDQSSEVPGTDRGRKGRRTGVTALSLAGLLLALSVGVAAGQNPDSDQASPPADAKAQRPGWLHRPRAGRVPIHGEFVVREPGGGFRTMAMQRGEATAVSDSSITVRSEDGFSRTYAVTGDTRVNRDGKIADIRQGEKVGVAAVVEGGNARALRIMDEDSKQSLRKQMRERREQMRERRRSMRPGVAGDAVDPPVWTG